MAYNYLIPVISSLPIGYRCSIEPPFHNVGRLLQVPRAKVLWRTHFYQNGTLQDALETELEFRDGELEGAAPAARHWTSTDRRWLDEPAFYENDFVTSDGTPLFAANLQPSGYVIYSAPGRKCFFSDQAYRYAAPPVIDQIAAYGRYIDSYPPVALDRARDHGESVTLINPYSRAIIAEVRTSDGREIRSIKIPARSARNIRLVQLLHDHETYWSGRIQISGSNRLISFDVKHSLKDPLTINDHEHLDPFRADPTHIPASRWLRQRVGAAMYFRLGILRK